MKKFYEGFEKRAEKSDDPSWWEKQKGASRAALYKDKASGEDKVDPEYLSLVSKEYKRGTWSGALKGALGGGAGGALIGRRGGSTLGGAASGALIGGVGGAIAGSSAGVAKGQQKYLADKGIDAKNLGLSLNFSPEAKKKYIDKYRKKK